MRFNRHATYPIPTPNVERDRRLMTAAVMQKCHVPAGIVHAIRAGLAAPRPSSK